jgi:hypothetical protein
MTAKAKFRNTLDVKEVKKDDATSTKRKRGLTDVRPDQQLQAFLRWLTDF